MQKKNPYIILTLESNFKEMHRLTSKYQDLLNYHSQSQNFLEPLEQKDLRVFKDHNAFKYFYTLHPEMRLDSELEKILINLLRNGTVPEGGIQIKGEIILSPEASKSKEEIAICVYNFYNQINRKIKISFDLKTMKFTVKVPDLSSFRPIVENCFRNLQINASDQSPKKLAVI